MATDLLKLFAQRNGCFPNKIVFYRDGQLSKTWRLFFSAAFLVGVDDGHFQKVLDNEVRALQNACKGKLVVADVWLNDSLFSLVFKQSIAEDHLHHCEKTTQYEILHLPS